MEDLQSVSFLQETKTHVLETPYHKNFVKNYISNFLIFSISRLIFHDMLEAKTRFSQDDKISFF